MLEKEIAILKAINLLKKCESVELASINEDGYPRICEMERMLSDGIERIYFTTKITSNKVRHFYENKKAGIGYCIDDDCVSLTGDIDIITDIFEKKRLWNRERTKHLLDDEKGSQYCILCFKAIKATIFIDGLYFETQL